MIRPRTSVLLPLLVAGTLYELTLAVGTTSVTSSTYFSVPAFFVTLREALEASVIVSIILQFLDKINRPELKRTVWIGTLGGFVCALAVGIGFVSAYYTLNQKVFVGKTEQLFEGFVMLFASIVIAILAVGMLQINKFREIWERKLQASLDRAEMRGTRLVGSTMFWIPFVSVLREGIEGVVFLTGASAGYPAKSIPIPGVLGLLAGVAVGLVLFRAGSRLNINRFMVASTAILLVIAAGLLSRSSHEFQEAGAFGKYKNGDGEVIASWNQPAWDICDCCSHDSNNGWAILRVIVGYTCDPSPCEIFFWLLFWVVCCTWVTLKLRLACFSKIPVKGAEAATSDELVKHVTAHSSKEEESKHTVAQKA